MNDLFKFFIACMCMIFLGLILLLSFTPDGVSMVEHYRTVLKKAKDTSNYETRKKVEDSARAMLSSYNIDKMTYEQYKKSENTEHHSWGEQAKMRANKTAITYNEYILKNSFIWEGNIPPDINHQLHIIE